MSNLSVLLRGPILSQSGYGVHSRQVARWLFEKEEELGLNISTELFNWGHTASLVDPEDEDGLVGRVLQSRENVRPFYDVTIQIQLPNEWNPLLGKYNIGVTAGVETDRCNPEWITKINEMHLVIVPSEFTKNTFINSGKLTTDIVVVNESFFDQVLNANSLSHLKDLELKTDINLLMFGQITGNSVDNDRKNLFYSIKWLCEILADRPDIGVVIKTNMIRNSKLDQINCINILNQVIVSSKKGIGPTFYLLHGNMRQEEIVGLYCHPKIKCLLSLTKGEGYGLPILEAAACGLPIITTNWSGHLDFMNLGKFLKVGYKLDKIHTTRVDNKIFMENAQWAYPDENEAKKIILKFVDNYKIPKEWAKELQEKLLKQFSFQKISKDYDHIILPILQSLSGSE